MNATGCAYLMSYISAAEESNLFAQEQYRKNLSIREKRLPVKERNIRNQIVEK